MTQLALDGVVVERGGFRLGPVDLTVGEEVLAVLGPSGCGKTTLVETVAGHRVPDRGEVGLGGSSLAAVPPEDRGTAVVFQEGALFPHMTARENVAYGGADPERVEGLAATLGVSEVLDRPATALSGGERQRVALARALAADPDALLLDEPLANLDAPIRRRLRADLRNHLADLGVPTVYVTHDQRAAAAVGDRLAVLREGRVAQVDTPQRVFRCPASAFVADFTGGGGVLVGETAPLSGGRVETRSDADTTGSVGLRVGERVVPAPVEGPPGRTVRLAVHRDGVTVTRTPGPDRLPGAVRACLFEGDRYRFQVELAAGPTLEAEAPASGTRPGMPDTGTTVHLHVPPGALHPLPGPADEGGG